MWEKLVTFLDFTAVYEDWMKLILLENLASLIPHNLWATERKEEKVQQKP